MRSPLGRRAFAWALLGSAFAWAEVTLGSAPGLSLRWSDPSGLAPLSQGELETRLSERLGHTAFDDNASQRALSVSWQGSAEQCRVELQLVRGNEVEGTRRIESPSGDCRSLGPALLTVAALLIESRPEPASEPAEVRPTAQPTHTRRAPAHQRRPQRLSEPSHSCWPAWASKSPPGMQPKAELGPAAAVVWTPIRGCDWGCAGVFVPAA